MNAHQAAEDPCSIRLDCSLSSNTISVVVIDSGNGFSAELAGIAFHDRFSKSGPHRGRGLLEVQDAVMQLHGQVQLVEVSQGEYRVALEFPRVIQ